MEFTRIDWFHDAIKHYFRIFVPLDFEEKGIYAS